MSSRHETPEEFDDALEREEISPQEYYRRVGFVYDQSYRVGFWRTYWQHPERGLPSPPQLEASKPSPIAAWYSPLFRFESFTDKRGVGHVRDRKTGRFVSRKG
jgi:hypothetical protein